MKFAALLRHSSEDLPELSELFRSYKQLKKRLKTLPQRCNTPAHQLSLHELRQREAVFVRAVLQNVQGFNDSFLDREEDAVIQLKTLEDAQVAARPERVQVRSQQCNLYRKPVQRSKYYPAWTLSFCANPPCFPLFWPDVSVLCMLNTCRFIQSQFFCSWMLPWDAKSGSLMSTCRLSTRVLSIFMDGCC